MMLKISRIISFIMILAYLAAGIFVLTSSRFDNMTKSMRIGFAFFLFTYSAFRAFRFYKLLKRPIPIPEEKEI